MRNYNLNEGFTLLELMVTIGVLAILMIVAVPFFLNSQRDAEVSNALRDAKVLEDAAIIEYTNPHVRSWTDGIAEEGEAEDIKWDTETLDLEGKKEFEQTFIENTQRLYNSLGNYFIVTKGEYEGYVFLKNPAIDSDGNKHVHPNNFDIETD